MTARGENLLGPYSRFRFHHPGPLFFWLAQPFYDLASQSHGGLFLTAVLVNLVSLGVLLLTVRHRRGSVVCGVGLLTSLLLAHLSMNRLFSASNPDLPILGFSTAIFCLAAAVSGRVHYLFPAVGLMSLATQSHLAFVPAASLISAAAAVCLCLPRLVGRSQGPRISLKQILGLLLFMVLLWWPVLYQEFTAESGNLSQIIAFFSLPHPRQTWMQSWTVAGGQWTGFLFGGWTPNSTVTLWLSSLLVPGLVATSVFAARKGDALTASLALLSVVGMAATVFSVNRIVGPVHEHLVTWISAVGLPAAVAVLMGVAALRAPLPMWVGRTVHLGLIGSFVGICLLNSYRAWNTGRLLWPEVPRHRIIEALEAQVATTLRRNPSRHPPEVRLAAAETWPVVAGVLLRLHKRGAAFCVEDAWLFMFGSGLSCSETQQPLLIFGDSNFAGEAVTDPRFELIADSPLSSAFIYRRPGPATRTVDFAGHDAVVYLQSGFVLPEPGGPGRWSYGPSSTLELPLEKGRAHRLELVARPFVVSGLTQSLRLSLNGRELLTFPMAERELRYLIHLPASQVKMFNRLRFDYGYAEPPILHRPHSNDWRPLAVFFRGVRIQPLVR